MSVVDGAGSGPRPVPRPVVLLTLCEDTQEARSLLDALGYPLVATVQQRRDRADPATFLGRGKLAEARQAIPTAPLASHGRTLIVADAELRPTVLFNLEDELEAEVWDRVRLILEIFQANARVKEARLQVELARLRYELPFVHEALHRQLTGEHPGFMGGGELAPRTYETHLKRRTKAILADLDRVKKERRTRRTGRRRSGLRLIAIAGYTNGGKSSLLNELTGAQSLARQQVFTTLQTATRRLRSEYHPGRASEVVFTDTVGFIRDLPPWLIDAFASTLEEITYADAVLLVVDASDDAAVVREKVRTAQSILDRIHAPTNRIVLLNKADLVPPERRRAIVDGLRKETLPPTMPVLWTSTRNKQGLQDLVDLLLAEILESRLAAIELDLARPEHLRLEHWLYEHTHVLASDERDGHRRLHLRCPLPTWGKLLHRVATAGAKVHLEAST